TFSSSRAVSSGEIFWRPVEFNVLAYKQLLQDGQIFVAMKNTVILTVVGTIINMSATVLAAYSLSKKRLKGRKVFLLIIIFTMLFNGGLIPNFILIKNLGLMNKYAGLWLMGLISTYNMFVMKTFFEGLPDSLEEAAAIDGANDIQILVRIVIPLSLPMLATLTLFYAVGWWNSYFNAMIYITSTGKMPLMVKLMQMLDMAQMIMINTNLSGGTEGIIENTVAPETLKAASIVIATLPILCIYPFLQKYFVKGVLIGSIKG
ncbi:MAG TPA: ABC transporter permease, partial [Clostridiaceae bacterium]|nr:ABC transporter permease [Clostridiaceae bacterium]